MRAIGPGVISSPRSPVVIDVWRLGLRKDTEEKDFGRTKAAA